MLDDRVVMIAGATGALGSAIAREFAQTQAQLVLTSRSMEKLRRLVAETDLPAERVPVLWDDVAQADWAEVLVKDIAVCSGRVDVLSNTVGGRSGGKPVAGASKDDN
jgi:3-oxoacyl-[acyl-carrier protein] reductase